VKTCRVVASSVLASAALGAVIGLSLAGDDTPTASRPAVPPLTLAEHGYFFVGGQYVESGGKRLIT
jgi:hypothetical protein